MFPYCSEKLHFSIILQSAGSIKIFRTSYNSIIDLGLTWSRGFTLV